MKRWGTEDGPLIVHLFKVIECRTPRVNCNENYRLWVIMSGQYGFFSCRKCPALVQMSIMEESSYL